MVLDSSLDKYPNKVVALHVDFNTLFGFDLIDSDSETNVTVLPLSNNTVVWSKGDTWGGDHCKGLAFSLNLTETHSFNANDESLLLPDTTSLIDRGAEGKYHEIRIHMQDKATLQELGDKLIENKSAMCVLTLELRIANRNVSLDSKKRKRPVMELEEEAEHV